MARRLTRKKQEFVNAYVDTGVGVKAALKAYNANYDTARSIAPENLSRQNIREAVEKALARRNLGPGRWAGVLDDALSAETEIIIGPGPTKTLKDHGTRMKAVDLAAELADAYPRNENRQEHRHLRIEVTEPIEVLRFKVLHGRTTTEREVKELMQPDETLDAKEC